MKVFIFAFNLLLDLMAKSLYWLAYSVYVTVSFPLFFVMLISEMGFMDKNSNEINLGEGLHDLITSRKQ